MVARHQSIRSPESHSLAQHSPGLHSPLSDGQPVPCVVMRGGTSRGLFFHEHDLPRNPALRDRVIMGAIGAPDPRQVDGLGGADMLLSKVAIVASSMRAGIDIECEFANIAPGKNRPTYGTNCGNLVAAVALFAIDEGLVSLRQQHRPIRIMNRNSGDLIEASIGSLASETEDCRGFSGMSSSGVCVELKFIAPAGATHGALLPTGEPRESFDIGNGRSVEASVVDAGALYVFVRARDFGLTATESAEQMQLSADSLVALEQLRCNVAHRLGLVDSAEDATRLSPDVPKLAFIGPPHDYVCSDRVTSIEASSVDLVSRIVSSQNFHQAYAVTGAIATAVAAAVPGSVVEEMTGKELSAGTHEVRIGHPSGILACTIENTAAQDGSVVTRAGLMRTARRVMQGSVVVPNSCF